MKVAGIYNPTQIRVDCEIGVLIFNEDGEINPDPY